MNKKKDFTLEELEQLLKAHQETAQAIITVFEKKQDVEFENFVGGNIPYNVCFGDYYFSMDDIYYDLYSNQPKGKILEHQDYIVQHSIEKGGNDYINYKSYCNGARFT
jgi:hypothetical protein